jgi:hypothetical protein
MKLFRQILMWISLAILAGAAGLSVLGAMLGTDKAWLFFNSVPMAAFWAGLLVLLAAGIVFFPVMFRRPGLGLMHLGCALVLAGGLWGSDAAHRLRRQHAGSTQFYKGAILIHQTATEQEVERKDEPAPARLDFGVKLKKFWIEFYDPRPDHWPLLLTRQEQEGDRLVRRAVPIEWHIGREVSLPGTDIHLTVEAYVEDSLYQPPWNCNPDAALPEFRLHLRRGQEARRVLWPVRAGPVDEQGWDALDLRFLYGDQAVAETKWAWAGEPLLVVEKPRNDNPKFGGLHNVKHYKSRLVIVDKDGRELPETEKVVEVNRPLHYGGYHFCQASWDVGSWRYTVLTVTSDSGLYVVYAGFVALCLGTAVQFWLSAALQAARRRQP